MAYVLLATGLILQVDETRTQALAKLGANKAVDLTVAGEIVTLRDIALHAVTDSRPALFDARSLPVTP